MPTNDDPTPKNADLTARLATYRRQRTARGATLEELSLLEEVDAELARAEAAERREQAALERVRGLGEEAKHHGNSGVRYVPAESFKANVAAAFQEANNFRRTQETMRQLASAWSAEAERLYWNLPDDSTPENVALAQCQISEAHALKRCAEQARAALASAQGKGVE
ncbi:hypothetical protein DEIPH_ctg052orf0037 [Deinococcus phoenicis]|uniref:Uncharacterized protein n=1 Tax=Deinococcus phoenicis TaxID=1476583 RepID=A0A016QLR0_9DEIO|nr:hypothetical protein [Deinococcus phoenicis]EYB67040.1 hypothetical protein DEIPH_ctg052orf0037 [Deinococcus phoenicis]